MRMVFGLVLLAGIALAGGAVYLAKGRIGEYQMAHQQAQEALAQIVPTVGVYVATGPLKYGQRLTREDVRQVSWPENAIPEGSFIEEAALFPENNDDLRVVLRAMEKDEAIMAEKVTEPGADAGLTSKLARGSRAFAIRVDVSSGVSGFLRPGDRVDVYWTGRINRGGNDRGDTGDVTKLIEAGVKIIAIDQSSNGQRSEAAIANTVTVAVQPYQVAALAQAQSTGNLSLSLVGAEDDTVAAEIEVDQRSLLGLAEETVKVEATTQKVCTIRTRRGAEVLEIPIPCTN